MHRPLATTLWRPFWTPYQYVPPAAGLPTAWGHWPLTDGSGTTAADISGTTDGTLYGTPTWADDATRGTCVDFDGTDDFIDFGTGLVTDTLSATAWIYLDTSGVAKTIIARRNTAGTATSGELGWAVNVASDNLANIIVWDEAGSITLRVDTAAPLPSEVWLHIAFSQRGAGLPGKIYVNGAPSGSSTQAAAGKSATTSSIQAGCRVANSDSRYFDGKMSDIRLFDYALSDAEINAIYKATVV